MTVLRVARHAVTRDLPESPVTPEQSEVDRILVTRARQLLSREERIGGDSRVQQRAWMKDQEFQARL